MRRCHALLPLAALLAVHTAALYLFTTGFFLTRFEMPELSRCDVLPSTQSSAPSAHLRHESTDDDTSASTGTETPGCWMPRRFRRVVFVVIDALRFDFVQRSDASATRSTFYSDRLPVLNTTLHAEPHNSLLLKFVADPPTMTMQRLKGLTTGSLPTFLDIKDNMATSSQIVEDNLLRQLRAQHRGVVFMGDDTWDALYAREFTRKFAFDSFIVKDLHSVDRGVTRQLFPELRRPDWDLLIAHFLGVDHVGHTHGPSSVFMAEKLDEMNGVLERLLKELNEMPDGDDTLLAVLGDHGMSADGNHGGASDDETGAALFLYSKAPLVATAAGTDDDLRQYAEKIAAGAHEVPQVDLVPTLALLSGLPIPFGNLGSVIPSLFFMPPAHTPSSGSQESSALAAFETLNRALRLNLDQVRRYLFRYSSASKLPERAYDQLERLFVEITRLEKQLQSVRGGGASESRAYAKADLPLLFRMHEELVTQQRQYLREALALGRSIWTQFDLCSMGWGMLLLMWSFIISVAVVAAPEVSQGDLPVRWTRRLCGALTAAALLFVVPTTIRLPLLPAAPSSRALVAASCTGLGDATLCSLRRHRKTVNHRHGGSSGGWKSKLTVSGEAVVAAVVLVLHALALLSNSYIVAEGGVMQYLSATTGFFLLICAQRRGAPNTRTLATAAAFVFVVATRVSSILEPPNIIKSSTTVGRTLVPLAVVAALAVWSSEAFAQHLRLQISSLGRAMQVSSVVSCVICAIFWLYSPMELRFWRLWLPRSVYLSFLGSLIVLLVHEARRARACIGDEVTIAPTSDRLLLLWQFVPCYMLVLGPTSPLSVLCLVLQCLSFVWVVACCHSSPRWDAAATDSNHRCGGGGDARSGTLWWVLLWASFSYQGFFTTGHANTFTSLQNAAGFVGFDDFNFYFAGALLGLNTFGSYALAVLALPWLHLTLRRPTMSTPATLLAFSSYFALNALVSTLFVALQRRHLMVWAIFAPKFLFDAVALLVTEALLLLLLAPFHGKNDTHPGKTRLL